MSLRRGPLQLVASSVLFGVMAFGAKRVSLRIPGPQVAFWRFGVGLLALIVLYAVRLGRPSFRRYDLLLVRGVLGGIAVLSFFSSIAHIDVSVATLLNYTSPVFTALFAARFLREPVPGKLIGALVLTLGGVVVVAHAHAPPGHFGFGLWEGVGLFGAVMSGGAVTAVRGLRLERVRAWEITTAFCLSGLFCTAPQTVAGYVPPTGTEWLALGIVGLLALVAQLLMNDALAFVGAALGGTIIQLTPIVTLILGALLLGERVSLTGTLGAVTTCVGVLWATWIAAETFRIRIRSQEPETGNQE